MIKVELLNVDETIVLSSHSADITIAQSFIGDVRISSGASEVLISAVPTVWVLMELLKETFYATVTKRENVLAKMPEDERAIRITSDGVSMEWSIFGTSMRGKLCDLQEMFELLTSFVRKYRGFFSKSDLFIGSFLVDYAIRELESRRF